MTSSVIAAPSDKETIDWLNSKLNGLVCNLKANGDTYRSEVHISSFKIENGVMTYKTLWRLPGSGQTPETHSYTARLRDLSSEIDLSEIPDMAYGRAVRVGLTSKDGRSNYPLLLDPTLGARVQKAFQHLLRNNGKVVKGDGKPANEPF